MGLAIKLESSIFFRTRKAMSMPSSIKLTGRFVTTS